MQRQMLSELTQWTEVQQRKVQDRQLMAKTQREAANYVGQTQAFAQMAEFLQSIQIEKDPKPCQFK